MTIKGYAVTDVTDGCMQDVKGSTNSHTRDCNQVKMNGTEEDVRHHQNKMQ